MFWEESNKPSWKYFEEDEENFEKLKIDSVLPIQAHIL